MVVEKVLPDFNNALCNMLSQIFGMYYTDTGSQSGGLCPLNNNLAMIQFTGNELEGELIIAVDQDAAEHLLSTVVTKFEDEILKRELLHSALGELANVTCIQLKESQSFKEIFGEVSMQQPVIWDAQCDETCIPFREGVSGEVRNGVHSIQTFIACSKANASSFVH